MTSAAEEEVKPPRFVASDQGGEIHVWDNEAKVRLRLETPFGLGSLSHGQRAYAVEIADALNRGT